MNSLLMRCKECGMVHEAVYPHLDPKEDQKYNHCQNCYADYLEFEPVTDLETISQPRLKLRLKILVE